jgi:hypothetical protein
MLASSKKAVSDGNGDAQAGGIEGHPCIGMRALGQLTICAPGYLLVTTAVVRVRFCERWHDERKEAKAK